MKIGRPVKDIDLKELKSLMAFYPSLEETAGWFDVSPDSISRLIKSEYDMTFAEFRQRFMAKTKLQLKRVAIEKALGGDIKMLTYCLRTLTNLDDRESSLLSPSEMSVEDMKCEIEELLYK